MNNDWLEAVVVLSLIFILLSFMGLLLFALGKAAGAW